MSKICCIMLHLRFYNYIDNEKQKHTTPVRTDLKSNITIVERGLDLTRSGIEPTIYCTPDEPVSHYTTKVVFLDIGRRNNMRSQL